MIYIEIDKNGLKMTGKYLGFTFLKKGGDEGEEVSSEQLPDDTHSMDKPAEQDDLADEDEDTDIIGESETSAAKTEDELCGDSPNEDSPHTDENKNEEEKEDKQQHTEDNKNKKDKTAGDKKGPAEKGGKKSSLASLKAKYLRIKPYIPTTWKYFRKLLKAVRISVDGADIVVGREDAHEAAIYYGIVQNIAAKLFTFLAAFFTLKVKRFDVDCVFIRNAFDGRGDLSVRVRPSAVIAIVVCFAVNFLIIRHKTKKSAQANA